MKTRNSKTTDEAQEIDRLRSIAEYFDCLAEEDFQLLAGITPSTAEAWRKRKTGPNYILFGNRYLYPRKELSIFLEKIIKRPVDQSLI